MNVAYGAWTYKGKDTYFDCCEGWSQYAPACYALWSREDCDKEKNFREEEKDQRREKLELIGNGNGNGSPRWLAPLLVVVGVAAGVAVSGYYISRRMGG